MSDTTKQNTSTPSTGDSAGVQAAQRLERLAELINQKWPESRAHAIHKLGVGTYRSGDTQEVKDASTEQYHHLYKALWEQCRIPTYPNLKEFVNELKPNVLEDATKQEDV